MAGSKLPAYGIYVKDMGQKDSFRSSTNYYWCKGEHMLANYGYKDASGDFFITIDTDKCDGCSDCVSSCPVGIFAVLDEDPNDPLRDDPVAVVKDDKKKKLKYECNPCKPASEKVLLPCIDACKTDAISHSW